MLRFFTRINVQVQKLASVRECLGPRKGHKLITQMISVLDITALLDTLYWLIPLCSLYSCV